MVQSGEKTQTVHARMSCRMAISLEAASQLIRQLNQLLQVTQKAQPQHHPENVTPPQEEVAKVIWSSKTGHHS
ncbi:MAG: hypothetical protein H6937_09245 [Burkholderiales bacterium]|nr:hypothetical protein [Burkholderiales bacterium]